MSKPLFLILPTLFLMSCQMETISPKSEDPIVEDEPDSAEPTVEASQTPLPATPPPVTNPPTTTPIVGVVLKPDDNLAEIVASKAEGTTFILKAGTHKNQMIIPKKGQIFIGEKDSSGKLITILSGENSTRYAFAGSASKVTIRNLIVEKYADPAQHGAIGAHNQSGNPITPAVEWIVEGNEVRYNAGGGIRVGPRSIVRGNSVHHNLQIGVTGYGADLLIERNEIAYNNYTHSYSAGWEAGGTKFWETTNAKLRCNYVHHNIGPGLWADNDNVGTLYEGNIVTDNDEMGIFHEISYAAVIRNNIVKRNGKGIYAGWDWKSWLYGSNILISSSESAEIYKNIVEVGDFGNGIGVLQQSRGSGAFGPHLTKNNDVHHNRITFRNSSGRNGVVQDWNGSVVFTSNKFNWNAYHVANLNQAHFDWNNTQMKFSSLQTAGQEKNGTIDSVITLDKTTEAVPANCPNPLPDLF